MAALSANPLALDLAELHEKFSPTQIIRWVRERLGVSNELRDPAVFRAAFKAYGDGSVDPESDALAAYEAFLAGNEQEVPLKVARCLLPQAASS